MPVFNPRSRAFTTTYMRPEVLSVWIPAKFIVQKGETAARRNPEASDRRPYKMGPRGLIALREIGKMMDRRSSLDIECVGTR